MKFRRHLFINNKASNEIYKALSESRKASNEGKQSI